MQFSSILFFHNKLLYHSLSKKEHFNPNTVQDFLGRQTSAGDYIVICLYEYITACPCISTYKSRPYAFLFIYQL